MKPSDKTKKNKTKQDLGMRSKSRERQRNPQVIDWEQLQDDRHGSWRPYFILESGRERWERCFEGYEIDKMYDMHTYIFWEKF